MVEGLTLTSEPFVQKHPIDGLDARKAPVVVAKGIREAILGGTYEPGARMRETELAERFKVSRSPIREALQILEKEGTLEAVPYRGAIVKPLSAQEGLEIAELHLALISLVAKPAYPQLSPADFDLAEDIAVRLNQTQDPVEFFYGIMGFWHIIFTKAQQPVLLEVLTQLESRATRYVPLFIRLFPNPEKRPRHREIFLEHYRKGKITEAVRAFRKEYWKQTRSVIDHVSSSNGSAPGSRSWHGSANGSPG
jgi:DNA-binding GntR family transcriptional regulator